MNNIKHALRQLVLRPGLSLVVIVMLALGIGGTTAMFSLFHQILVQPLPVPEPERLVNLSAPGPKLGGQFADLAIRDPDARFSYPMFRDLEAGQRVFTGIAGHKGFLANVAWRDEAQVASAVLVSGSYFDVLGLRPALGRLITPGDEPQVGESAVAVLSHDFWQSQLGGGPDVLGQTMIVNGQRLEIVGVAPAGFHGTTVGTRPQVFVPLTLRWLMEPAAAPDHEYRQSYWLYLFARLAPGVTVEQASAALNGLYAGILNDLEGPELRTLTLPDELLSQYLRGQVALSPGARGQSFIPATAARPLVVLLGLTALVLAIVCVNIANLLLARGASRAGEMAVRASIGASRGRMVVQLMTESALLVAVGCVVSLAVAVFALRLITGLLPAGLAAGLAPELSGTAMLFAVAVSLATVLLFGVAPAWRASDADPARVMKQHASQSPGGHGAVAFRGTLTSVQIALSMVLLVLAGLFTQSLVNVARVDLGMDVDSLVTFSISPQLSAYVPERVITLTERLEEALGAEPGVLAVGAAGLPLLADFAFTASVSVEGLEEASAAVPAAFNYVGAGFFDALSVPLLAGRDFTEQDTEGSPPVVIVNAAFVRRLGLDDPVGRRLGFGASPDAYPFEIVGVVADTKHSVKDELAPQFFFAWRQQPGALQSLFYYVRAGVDPEALLSTIPRVIASIDPDVPVSNLATMTRRVQDNVYVDRLLSMLSAGFAGLATLLAAIGLYGVLAYNVTQRTRELGLRLALGAEPGRLRAMVLKQVAVMASIGGAIGLAAALGLGRVAEALLFGLSGHDPLVLVLATAVLAVVVFTASWLPARRASNIAPMEALRHE